MQLYLEVIVPADGTRAATVRNGDFGTSPIFGQLSDKPLLAIEVNVHIDDFKVQSLLRRANFLLLRRQFALSGFSKAATNGSWHGCV